MICLILFLAVSGGLYTMLWAIDRLGKRKTKAKLVAQPPFYSDSLILFANDEKLGKEWHEKPKPVVAENRIDPNQAFTIKRPTATASSVNFGSWSINPEHFTATNSAEPIVPRKPVRPGRSPR